MIAIWEAIRDWFIGIGDSVREFFIAYGGNPLLWVGIIIGGLVVFQLTHQALRTKGE